MIKDMGTESNEVDMRLTFAQGHMNSDYGSANKNQNPAIDVTASAPFGRRML